MPEFFVPGDSAAEEERLGFEKLDSVCQIGESCRAYSLQPAETKIETSIRHVRQGKGKLTWIPLFSQLIDDRTPRVTQAEEFRNLIQGFPRGIISCPSDEPVIHFRLHQIC